MTLNKYFAECETVVESKTYYENCLYDSCAAKDAKNLYCSALHSYATECAQNNVKFNWSNEVPECCKNSMKQISILYILC